MERTSLGPCRCCPSRFLNGYYQVCPTGATFRTETYTAVNAKRCIACGLCTMVCPFGAIHIATVKVNGHIQENGDVLARVMVRALEMIESCQIIEQALDQLPNGEWKGQVYVELRPGEAVARIGAPRGEVFYYLASDGSEKPLRVKVRRPSFVNMPAVRLMLKGATLADAPLIQASIDPCYSCTDR